MDTMEKILPDKAGVYLFKDTHNTIIYVGKATSIRSRVRSYFTNQKIDWKSASIIAEHKDIEYIITKNEAEAAILEAHLIRDYQPKFNVSLKSGNPFIYLLFSVEKLPKIKVVRTKKEKGFHFGPFMQKRHARAVHAYLVKTFRLKLCKQKLEHGCLDYHLGICAGTCRDDFDEQAYRLRLHLAMDALKNDQTAYTKKIQEHINQYNKALTFEKAKYLSEYLHNYDKIVMTIKLHFSPAKFATSISLATAPIITEPIPEDIAMQTQAFLKADKKISTIDCFDISHFQSKSIVGSCVRFVNGKPDKQYCRRFLIKSISKQDDYAALREIVERRYKEPDDLPDAILIDGGKGQLNAIKDLVPNTYCMSLAKKEERLFCPAYPDGVHLPMNCAVGKQLIALRDYAHHFAISYHRKRRSSFPSTPSRRPAGAPQGERTKGGL